MPNRIIRAGIIKSKKVNSLSFEAEILYRRLLNIVDDYARHEADLDILRADCYPRKLDSVSENNIKTWLEEIVEVGLAILYNAGGDNYLEIVNFGNTPRAKKSRCPDYDEQMHITCAQMFADAPVYRLPKPFTETETPTEQPSVDEGLKKSKKTKPKLDLADGFEEFWRLWPTWPPGSSNKTNKAGCLKKWKSQKCHRDKTKIIQSIQAMLTSEKWNKNNHQFTPAPNRWIEEERWRTDLSQIQKYQPNPDETPLPRPMTPARIERLKTIDRWDHENNCPKVMEKP